MRNKSRKLSAILMGILVVTLLMTGCGQEKTVEAGSEKNQEVKQKEEKKKKTYLIPRKLNSIQREQTTCQGNSSRRIVGFSVIKFRKLGMTR